MNTYVGCCCAEDMQAVMQAAVDQLVGFATLTSEGHLTCTVTKMCEHSLKVTAFVQSYLDDYAMNHGCPDAIHMAAAEQMLAEAMK
jgi:hypothetical protein